MNRDVLSPFLPAQCSLKSTSNRSSCIHIAGSDSDPASSTQWLVLVCPPATCTSGPSTLLLVLHVTFRLPDY